VEFKLATHGKNAQNGRGFRRKERVNFT